MRKTIQYTKIMVTLAALYFAFHAGQALINRCAEINFGRTMLVMEGTILVTSAIVMIAVAILIWREL
jgi:hypothetical protein